MKATQKRALAKKLYVAGNSLSQIADVLTVSVRTVQNYKSNDGDWDEARAAVSLENGGEKLYTNFVTYMDEFVREIKEADIKPEIKAEKISQIGDAFAKMKRIAQLEDPKLFTHGIIRHTLKTLLAHAKRQHSSECLKALVDLIEQTQEELADVSL